MSKTVIKAALTLTLFIAILGIWNGAVANSLTIDDFLANKELTE